MKTAVRFGVVLGMVFACIGVAFVAISILTDVSRPTWQMLNIAKGLVGFGLCGLAGFLAVLRGGSLRAGVVAGMVAGALAGAVVPTSMYLLAYGLLDHVRQYPFEYYDFLNSGAPDVRSFLLTESGRATVFSTSVGLVPIVLPLAAGLGGLVGLLGGAWARLRPGRGMVPTRPNKRVNPRAGGTSFRIAEPPHSPAAGYARRSATE